ncbi:hypothetical protein ACFVHB_29675 [Kitasatospora sp. NPDC127111]|uniref:hypothetical protein n=1 Tax=Kitasatospora sp. NPDC127111 TaxID=3345363 RepID=UPI00363EF926
MSGVRGARGGARRGFAVVSSVALMAAAAVVATAGPAAAADFSECLDRAGESCLVLGFTTGGDDLRGGNDNLDVTVTLTGVSTTVRNVNGSGSWGNGSFHQVTIDLQKRFGHLVMPNEITNVALHTTFGGGIGGDNWNLNHLTVGHDWHDVLNGIHFTLLADRFGNPLFRFTGDRKDFNVRL